MEQVNLRRIFFFTGAALGASFVSSSLFRASAAFGPANPTLTGIAAGIALALIAAFYRWFFERQFDRTTRVNVYAWVLAGAVLVTVFAYVAGWAERQAWLTATVTLAAWWLLWSQVLAKRKGNEPPSL